MRHLIETVKICGRMRNSFQHGNCKTELLNFALYQTTVVEYMSGKLTTLDFCDGSGMEWDGIHGKLLFYE